MTHIFISYAKKDTRELALSLADALSDIEGVTAWVDRSLRAGRSWELQIQAEIDKCDTMVVLYSPDINRHKNGKPESYVLNEIGYARHFNKQIIPIMAQETTPPLSLITHHYIDFTLRGLQLGDLVDALCDEVGIDGAKTEIPIVDSIETPKQRLPKPQAPDASADAVLAIIGEPFEWCEVPAGDFIYGEGFPKCTLNLPTFSIAKYPITYGQYQAFVEASDGLQDTHWWQGLARSQNNLGDQEWKIADHPRERVSWYDSMAFCRWLSWKLGGEYRSDTLSDLLVRLPTEFEWEKAARGTNGLKYPYGNQFDKNKSNTEKSRIGQTTPVTQYPQGASPYRVLDMSGNVFEWCLTDYNNPQMDAVKENIGSNARRVLRGGSWRHRSSFSRIVYRDIFSPFSRLNPFGFRLCRPSF